MLEHQYVFHLSNFTVWPQREHARDWILFPENLGTHLSIDEPSLSQGELYTVVTNKAAKGKKGSLVARSRYLLFKAEDKWTPPQWHRAEILFRRYPDLEKAYRLSRSLARIYQTSKIKGVAFTKLAQWYNEVEQAGFKSFSTVSRTIQNHYSTILNFFDNRNTNASAESFNAKIKAFRAQFRGVTNIEFFLFRLSNIYA